MSPATLGDAPVTAVLFDYGLTLMTYTRPADALHRAYSRIAATLGDPRWDGDALLDAVHDRVDARVAAHEATGSLEEIDITAAHREAYADLGIALDSQQLDDAMREEQVAWWEGIHVAPDTAPTLHALRHAGLRLGICSNAPYRPASMREQLQHVGLLPLVDAAVFSGEVGWRKPAPQIFAAALRALGAEPRSTVHVGDRVREDVDGAHAAGMRAVRIREHHDDADPDERADAVIDRLAYLPALLRAAGGRG
ncbi:MAG TPA: HAD family hydrolase [Candidatus Dormibacteraeota bacterium]|nr:HAD family hydrolase [Candidatus Dormibacteraeota bacterium]